MGKEHDPFDIRGKTIALIGATGLLGTRYADFLSSRGANLVIGDLDADSCSKSVETLRKKYGTDPLAHRIDNSDEASIRLFFDSLEKKYEGLDVLINNAQGKPEGFYRPFEQYTKETISKVLDVNLVGPILCCREACRIFLRRGKGVIINVASIYGLVGADQRIYEGAGNPYFPGEKFSSPVSYAVSKAGILNLTRYLASYYRGKNIRVNSLTPGGVHDGQDPLFTSNYSGRTSMDRMAEGDEFNGAILFLCSDASSYMTGANLVIDGGWTGV